MIKKIIKNDINNREENMKFVHIADVHFDRPFTTLEGKNLSNQRRIEQRNAFREVIEYVRENNILIINV